MGARGAGGGDPVRARGPGAGDLRGRDPAAVGRVARRPADGVRPAVDRGRLRGDRLRRPAVPHHDRARPRAAARGCGSASCTSTAATPTATPTTRPADYFRAARTGHNTADAGGDTGINRRLPDLERALREREAPDHHRRGVPRRRRHPREPGRPRPRGDPAAAGLPEPDRRRPLPQVGRDPRARPPTPPSAPAAQYTGFTGDARASSTRTTLQPPRRLLLAQRASTPRSTAATSAPTRSGTGCAEPRRARAAARTRWSCSTTPAATPNLTPFNDSAHHRRRRSRRSSAGPTGTTTRTCPTSTSRSSGMEVNGGDDLAWYVKALTQRLAPRPGRGRGRAPAASGRRATTARP